MADFNTKYILPGDDKDTIINKINHNFYQVFFNGVGERGPVGYVGATGIRGQAGRDGEAGATGERAADWFFSSTEPSDSESQNGDIWINIGVTGGQQVYVYTSGSWVNTGQTLLSSGVFSTITGVSGPGNSTSNNAIYINGSQGDKTFVLSDSVGATSSMNPNLSKVIVSTDTSQTSDFPIVGFAKTFLTQTPGGIVSMKWSQTGSSYDHKWNFPGETRIQSGLSSTYSATGGTMTLSAPNQNLNVSSRSTASFTAATGGTGTFSFSTPGIFSFSSSYANLSASSFDVTISNPGSTGYIAATVSPYTPLASLSGSGNGVNITAASETSDELLQVLSTTGKDFIKSERTNRFSIGGANGATGAYKVKGITNTTQNLLSDGVDYYVNCGNPTNDVCVITPGPLYSGSPSANGKANRVLLNVGSNFSWAAGLLNSGESRTFDFFMNSSTFSFGGIRVVKSGIPGVGKEYINDNTAGEDGCQHIRLTFFPVTLTAKFHYEAFSDDHYECGWETYTIAVTTAGGGGGGGFLGL
jgi:hypothetical protein